MGYDYQIWTVDMPHEREKSDNSCNYRREALELYWGIYHRSSTHNFFIIYLNLLNYNGSGIAT